MAVTPGGVPSRTLGGLGFHNTTVSGSHPGGITVAGTDKSSITLWAGVISVGVGAVYPFRNGLINTGYQVPASTTLYVDTIMARVGVTVGGYQLMSDTVVFLNTATTASLTAPVYQAGAAALYPLAGHVTAWTTVVMGFGYKFAASTFPGVQCANNTELYQIGIIGRLIAD